ncbi:uncharacterized protein KY384_006992 [Bacidia gigantensis]|uniref:uncharacterized protein n=1 Tax=Bacidia gigantensis TaxID=2732470 RepID=UPI001D042AD5|nr:uncharacterized protein KY384_006992 [Bacidia gigantensis]KAG8528076.1 hypothetical protein KY384_006992 [Bacidia gigantensis]
MSHAHHNHHGHGGNGDHDHGHSHDHSDEIEPALQSSIYKQIEFDNVRCLNESETDAGRRVVEKTFQQRLEPAPELVSDADEQLILFVPFAGVLKLHSVLIRASDSSSCPQTLKLYHNHDDLDFSTASDLPPTQMLHISRTNEVQELPVKRTSFSNVYNLSLFIENNHGADESRLYWVGFKGEFTKLNREPFEVLYEKAANPKDHEVIAGLGEKGASRQGT